VTVLRTVALLLVAVTGTGVVAVRDPRRQAVVAGVFGLVLALLFFLFQAPDVAIAQIVVVTVGLPLMMLLALARVSGDDR
jgi:energy-converting hydrogenase B subunit D